VLAASVPLCSCFDSSLQARLQVIVDRASFVSLGTGLSLGVATAHGNISISAGPRRGRIARDGDRVQPEDKFAMGSTTKMYTAAAVLRLVDAGRLGLDDKALPLIDRLWTKLNGTSLAVLLGPRMRNVTVRHLLQMQSGIPDFDTLPSRKYQLNHPTEDLGPVRELAFLPPKKDFSCDPGTCGEYSSTNYELLGLLLAQQSGAGSWDTYSQASGLPAATMAAMRHTSFVLHGTCGNFTPVHGYSAERHPRVDVSSISCTNGWTCGNLMSSAGDAAFFVRALLGGEQVLTAKTLKEMMSFKPLTQGWSTGLQYGLGLMNLTSKAGEMLGHGGETFGFASWTAYDPGLDVGVSVAANTENVFLVELLFKDVHEAIRAALAPRTTAPLLV